MSTSQACSEISAFLLMSKGENAHCSMMALKTQQTLFDVGLHPAIDPREFSNGVRTWLAQSFEPGATG